MSKKGINILIISIALLGTVGAAAALTKGFTSFFNTNQTSETDKTSSKESERINLRTFDFSNEQSGSLNETSLLNFVNSHNREKKEVFSQVSEVELPEDETVGPCVRNVFLDGSLGIRLGTQNDYGYLSLDCVSSYKFDHLRIEAVNYNKFGQNNQYEKEINGSKLDINGYEIDLKANSSLDTSDTKVTKTLTFADLQSSFSLIGTKGRPCILKLELWSE